MTGLTEAEVAIRKAQGETNYTEEHSSRTVKDILVSNICTRFNAILGALLVVVLWLSSFHDAVFGIVLVVNSAIGIIQELRAKRTLDKLSIISASLVTVIRNSIRTSIPSAEVVKDDVVTVSEGEQIVTDGEVLAMAGFEVDESLLTGEAEAVTKKVGDILLSGSFVLAGEGVYRATHVGEYSYSSKLAAEAKKFSVVHSELQTSINTILRFVSWILVPAALLLFFTEKDNSNSLSAAMFATVSGLVGMIPQGLVLLCSVAFAVSVIRLGKRNVLVQELPAVETLARVDVVCFDKTGTLTEGPLGFNRLEVLEPSLPVDEALSAVAHEFAYSGEHMYVALSQAKKDPLWHVTATVPFSPKRRFSAATFENQGSWIMGAPEVLLEKVLSGQHLLSISANLARSGARVLLLAHTKEEVTNDSLPTLTAAGFVVLTEKVRHDAPEALKYFEAQGVSVKVISGDNPFTVATIAREAGLLATGEPVDARVLSENPEDLLKIMEEHSVFGRVSPQQKKAMIQALQKSGHVVAMLGDGVNDVLAIKQADVGITVGTGTSAAKAVAQLVLLDGTFATLPHVVAEGRRVLGNMERVANLFVTKTVYATLLVVSLGLLEWPFLLLPRQFTLIDIFTIGVPAFFLALAPNTKRYETGFLSRLMRFALPAGTVLALAVVVSVVLAKINIPVELPHIRTLATLVLSILGLYVLAALALPLRSWRGALVAAMAVGFAVAVTTPITQSFFALEVLPSTLLLQTGVIILCAAVVLHVLWTLTRAHIKI